MPANHLPPPVKDQYFGDTRDLSTYDLALHCMQHAGLRRLTFIPT